MYACALMSSHNISYYEVAVEASIWNIIYITFQYSCHIHIVFVYMFDIGIIGMTHFSNNKSCKILHFSHHANGCRIKSMYIDQPWVKMANGTKDMRHNIVFAFIFSPLCSWQLSNCSTSITSYSDETKWPLFCFYCSLRADKKL